MAAPFNIVIATLPSGFRPRGAAQSHAPTRHCLVAKHHDRERALLQNPEIADAAVLGVPDAVFGETVASAQRKAPRMKVAGLLAT